ncbi:hypothetical protein ACFQYP_23345 [Nonomuraea antimicrobica]
MGLDLSLVPEVVRPLALPLTGGAVPEADVPGIIAEARALESLADDLAAIEVEGAGSVVRLLSGHEWQGAAKDAFERLFAMLGGEQEGGGERQTLIDLLERALREEAASLRQHGVRMEHTEWMIYASLALLGLMIVRLLVFIAVNGPGVLRLIQHQALMTRMSIQTFKKLVLRNTLLFGGIMGGLDALVQLLQWGFGVREPGDIDFGSLAVSVGSGALTGVLFTGVNAGLSRLLSRQMVYLGSKAELAVRDRVVAITQSLYGQALVGGVAATGVRSRGWRSAGGSMPNIWPIRSSPVSRGCGRPGGGSGGLPADDEYRRDRRSSVRCRLGVRSGRGDRHDADLGR